MEMMKPHTVRIGRVPLNREDSSENEKSSQLYLSSGIVMISNVLPESIDTKIYSFNMYAKHSSRFCGFLLYAKFKASIFRRLNPIKHGPKKINPINTLSK